MPRCGLPAGLTGHSADAVDCREPRRDDYRIDTLCDASGNSIGGPLFNGPVEGQRPVLADIADGLLNHRSR
jgi:hypothetical protein